MPRTALLCRVCAFLLAGWLAGSSLAIAQPAQPPPGRSDPSFQQPSLVPGADYVVPSPEEIKITLDRVLDHFVRSTPYKIIDSASGQTVTDFSKPTKTAGIDRSKGEFNDWTYSMGAVMSGMLLVTEVTGDARYADYTVKNFDFIFDHLDYFRRQAAEFGPQPDGYRRMLEMRELDDCGSIGAALVRAYGKKPDPRYRTGIDLVDAHIAKKQLRLADGTLARPRPWPVALWIDDAYMSIPFLAQMGKFTGNRAYYDDAAKQVIGMSKRLFHEDVGLYDHTWFEHAAPYDPKFFWGRGAGWMLVSMADLLTVMPEDHPDRAKVLHIYRRAVQGVAQVQGSNGMWHQLLDRTDSYFESSATAMFTFAIARGVNRGWLPTVYAPVAQAGWQALSRKVRADGQIEGICVSTTAAADAAYYYNRPTELGAMQGYGAALMAGAEVMVLVKSFDISRTNNTFYYREKKK
jgi:rhamnogalacturonyl hydrolase YesR